MSVVYRIREWDARYEVNSKNGVWLDGQEKRRNAFDYVRMPVHGRALTRTLRRLNSLAGKRAPAVMGVFTKLMELAADNKAAFRGWIVESDGTPMSAVDIAETLQWPVEVIEAALKVLTHNELRWVEVCSSAQFSAELRGTPGSSKTDGFPQREDQDQDHNEDQDKPKTRVRARTALGSASADAAPRGEESPGSGKRRAGKPAPTREPPPPTPSRAASDEAMRRWSLDALAAKTAGLPIPPKPMGRAVEGNGLNITLPAQDAPSDAEADEKRRCNLNQLWTRIQRATGDDAANMAWWASALLAIADSAEVCGILEAELVYVVDCSDEKTRAVKGLGELKNPGGYLTSKVLAAARKADVRLPARPKCAKGAA